MSKYRRKPIIVDAYQYEEGKDNSDVTIEKGRTYIKTLEGNLDIQPGDWIITGIKGEKYACKPDIFEVTYEVPDRKKKKNDSGDRIEELTHDLQRLQAEFLNYKRRENDAKSELLEMATREVVTLLLPTLDNIDRALAHRPEELADNAWAGGVEQVGKQAGEALKKMGVERIEAVGQPFDHNLHEAISYEDGDGEQEVVVEELQPGYTMGGKVIRHAMVKVGRQ